MTKIRYAFRLVHVQNIPHVLKDGFVHKDSPKADPNFVPIGDTSVISVRSQKQINGSYRLDGYIPFYFGPRSPMLYVIQHGYNGVKQYNPEDLVYCVIRLEDVIASNIKCIFTDGHALNYITNFYSCEKLPRIDDFVKYSDVYTSNWVNEDDRDLKRRKEAELLIKDELSPDLIRGFVVYNKDAREKLIHYGVEPKKIVVKSEFFF